ncbi:protein of unknown function DUF1736 [Trinorchestia longiramus]|nr:protein of unknown function DUF1736 [Trinorchestia longiramus]
MRIASASPGTRDVSSSPSKFSSCTGERKPLFYPDFSGVSCFSASLIVSLFALVCFMGSIEGEFVFDDSEAIINNVDIRWQSPVADVFSNDFWGTRLTHPSSHKSYRPLTVLSFRLNHLISGLTPGSYHAFNVVLHCLVSVSALHVFIHLLHGSRQCALLAGVLFATHPIHTEAVAGIVGRADLLCALFVFCALLAYIRAIREDSHSARGFYSFNVSNGIESSRKSRGSPALSTLSTSFFMEQSSSRTGTSPSTGSAVCTGRSWLTLCAVCTTVAMLCKEVGITALGLCSAYEVLIVSCGEAGGGLFCVLPLGSHRRRCLRKTNACLLKRHLFLLVVGSSLLLGRFLIMGSAVPRFMQVDNPASFMDSSFLRVLNYQYIYLLNVVLMLLPLWLCFDWSMGCVPLIETLTDARALSVPLLWVVLALLVYRGVLGKGVTARCVLMSLAVGAVPFLPATNLFFRVGFVIAERVLYIPVAGLCCLVVVGMKQLRLSGFASRRGLGVLYWALVLVFVLRCRQRTCDWCSELQLFRSGLLVHYNLGKVAGDAGDEAEAVARYREAIRLNPMYDQAMNNLANILKDKGSLLEAEALLQNATSLRPDFAAAWMNLGIVQASLGHREAAHESYTTALQHRPVYPDCLYNLGNLYLERNLSDDALSAWRNATALKPSLSRAWINTLILLDSRQQYETAVTTAHVALKHLPDEASIHFNLANTLGKLGRYKESETHFLSATRLDPANANYWSNLGVLYHRWKKYKDAEITYRHTLKLNPELKSAKENLHMLLKSGRHRR